MMDKIIKMAVIVIFMLFIPALVIAADVLKEDMDLENYPGMFINNERLDVNFVVGEFAQSEDVLATVEIAGSLQENLKEILKEDNSTNNDLFEIDITGNPQDELTELYMDVFNKRTTYAANTILDTSLDIDSLVDKNLIIVGGPCVNWVAAHFYDNPENCAEGFLQGRGQIQLFRNGKGIVMVVAGYSADDTRTAANILSHYNDYYSNFVGTNLRVSSAWISEIKVE